ncbi:hypothetical protein AAFN85_00575 [Mucilaginibacter sp. CAU 1740]|uniref:hypothetical protein n=1 Tax=Mucilaginibacter sp. CAU 1740 TaxID=3140365 RepID=UPI00325BC377
MRIKLVIILSVVVLFASCKKDPESARIIVNIKSGSGRKVNVYISKLSDQTKIYLRKDTLSAISDANGQLSFKVIPNKTYYLYHYISDEQIIAPSVASFIKAGVFSSAEEINNWPRQTPPATVGGIRYQDINGDGAIDRYDEVLTVTAPAAGKTLNIDFPLIDR